MSENQWLLPVYSLMTLCNLGPSQQRGRKAKNPKLTKKTTIILKIHMRRLGGFPGGSVVKNPPANAGDMGLISGWGRFPGEGNGNPLQYLCLGNPMDREAWWATVQGGHKRVGHNLVSKQQQSMVYHERARVKSILHRRMVTLRYGDRITYLDQRVCTWGTCYTDKTVSPSPASLWASEKELDDSSVVKSWFQGVWSISWHQPQNQHCFAWVKTLPKIHLQLSVKVSGHLPRSVWKGSGRSSGRKHMLWMNSKLCGLLHPACLKTKKKPCGAPTVGHGSGLIPHLCHRIGKDSVLLQVFCGPRLNPRKVGQLLWF